MKETQTNTKLDFNLKSVVDDYIKNKLKGKELQMLVDFRKSVRGK